MTAADTAMVIAVSAALGGFRPMATVGQTISFLRPVANDDVLVEARVLRLGRTLAFGEISLRAAASGALVAHGTTTYALPSER
jgi:acyl-coenzyme A thioesterase PaaI-like protein